MSCWWVNFNNMPSNFNPEFTVNLKNFLIRSACFSVAALDVKKQGDLSGFYRHIYRQTMGEEKADQVKVKKEDDEEKRYE